MKEIGVYHQALEDFHGICGDNEVTQACAEGKCSWVVVAALKLASSGEFEVIMVRIPQLTMPPAILAMLTFIIFEGKLRKGGQDGDLQGTLCTDGNPGVSKRV